MLKQDLLLPFESNATWKPKTRHFKQMKQSKRINLVRRYQRNREHGFQGTSFCNSRVHQHSFKPMSGYKCDRKIDHENRRVAIEYSDSWMYKVCMTFGPMVPYYCGHHSAWHIGHDTKFPRDRRVEYHERCVERAQARLDVLRP